MHGIDHSFQDPVIETWIRWRNEDKKLDLLDLQGNSKDCSLNLRGDLNLVEPYHYDLDLKQLELRGQAVALMERRLFGENRIMTPDKGVLRLLGKLGGSANVLKPESIDGEFSVADLTLSLPNIPEPVHSVHRRSLR